MAKIDACILDSLRAMTPHLDGDVVRFEGTMVFAPELEGPPGRVHGGIHPLVRTLPILARLRGDGGLPTRIAIDATLGQALPLGTEVAFDGTYVDGEDGPVLTTRFLASDRLIATATNPRADDLPAGPALERLSRLFAQSEDEAPQSLRIMGVPYRVTPSLVLMDVRTRAEVEPSSHLAHCLTEDGKLGLTALCTQLDAVGASARGVTVRHPHFTKHITLAFDLAGLEDTTELRLFGDRTSIREIEGGGTVTINGVEWPGGIAEVVAADARFERCFAHGFVTSHPVDPAKFAGFQGMRRLRES
jgi:hypothetical protein